MATCTFVGNAIPIAQVITLTPGGTWEVGDLITIAFGAKTRSYAVTSTVIATFVPLFVTDWNALAASEYPEFAEITASGTSTIILTCDTKGKSIPLVATTTESNGAAADSQTLSQSTTTAATGPNVYDSVANWSGGAVPVNSDDIIVDGAICNKDILYNLDQSAVTAATFRVINGYTGKIGLPERNTDNSTDYDEYRPTELKIGATVLDISCNSGRIKIDNSSIATAATIRTTGNSSDTTVPAVQWRGTHASNTLAVEGGTVGVALLAGHTAVAATVRQSGGVVVMSSGVTLTTVTKAGGTLTIESATTSLTNDAGDVTIKGSGAHAAITNSGGTVYYESSGTITAYTGNNTGAISFDRRNVARTLTAATLNDTASFTDKNRTVTHSAAMAVNGPIANRVTGRRSYTVTPT